MRQEEEERRKGEQVDDVAAVDHALREAVEVVEERELEEGGRDPLADRRLVPGGEPGEDEDAVGEHGAHHLVLAHGGGGRAAGDEGDAEEGEVAVEEVAGQQEEDGGEHPGERPAAHGRELAPADEERLGHFISWGPVRCSRAALLRCPQTPSASLAPLGAGLPVYISWGPV